MNSVIALMRTIAFCPLVDAPVRARALELQKNLWIGCAREIFGLYHGLQR